MRLSGRSARSRNNRVGARACDSTLRGRSSSSSPRSSPPSRVKNALAPRLSLDDDPTNDERHFHISSRYIKFDHPSSSVPFLKKSGYQRAALPAAATIRLSPRTRMFVSRGQFISLRSGYCNRRGARSDIERDDKKRATPLRCSNRLLLF